MKKIIFKGFGIMCLAFLYTFLIDHINSIYEAFVVRDQKTLIAIDI